MLMMILAVLLIRVLVGTRRVSRREAATAA
jgi:hypothetical protein